MRSHIFCVHLAVILLVFVLITGLAVPAQADIKELTWDPGTSGWRWKSAANWSGPSGHRPDDNDDKAIFPVKGSIGNPLLDGNLEGSGDGLGQLVFNGAGWTVLNESGEDNIMNFSSVQYFSYDAIFSSGVGTNRIKPKVNFIQTGQNVYTGSGNTLVFEQLSGLNAFVVSSTNPTSADTGVVKLEGNNSSITNAFVVRQGTLLVANNNALGSGGGTIYFADDWSSNNANAKLLTDGSFTVSKNLEVRNIAGHQVNAFIGGNQSSGNSYFTGTVTLNRNATLTSAGGGVYFNNTISGTGGITKTGAGTVVLAGSNTYLGATSVDAGTLLVNGTHTGGGTYTVSSGTMLGGTGSINANVNVQNGGFLSPGAYSIESLDVTGAVTLGGTLKIEIDGSTGLCDLLDVTSSLDITSGIVDFDVLGVLSSPAYIFAKYNSLTGSQFSDVIDLPTGYIIDYNYQNSEQIAVVIPEPATVCLLGLGGLGLLRRRKRS